MFFEKNRPAKPTVWISIERQNTGFRPLISANLGRIKAAEDHPMKSIDPIKPIFVFDSQVRSNCSTQLFRDWLLSQSTL